MGEHGLMFIDQDDIESLLRAHAEALYGEVIDDAGHGVWHPGDYLDLIRAHNE